MEITDKNIILTGASSGIGAEVLQLLQNYADVKIIAVARNVSDIKAVEGVVYPFSADLNNPEGVDSLFDFAKAELGNIDLFIANAGFAYLEYLHKPDWQHIQNIFSLNVTSVVYSLEKMCEQAGERKIQFVAISSSGAFIPLPAYSLYVSTKAALHQFMETYRYEKTDNVTLTTVYPVATRTDFFDKAGGKPSPVPAMSQDVKTVARKIVKGIEKGRKKIYPMGLIRIVLPFIGLFPFAVKIYANREKRKIDAWGS